MNKDRLQNCRLPIEYARKNMIRALDNRLLPVRGRGAHRREGLRRVRLQEMSAISQHMFGWLLKRELEQRKVGHQQNPRCLRLQYLISVEKTRKESWEEMESCQGNCRL